MKRKIIKITNDKCNGCGICVTACNEGALQIINGKATLISDIYCDGLGSCLPTCPTGAIEIIEREAEEFSEKEVEKLFNSKCKSLEYKSVTNNAIKSSLVNWPCQLKLIKADAKFLRNKELLIAADCTAFAYPNIQEVMKYKITLIGCPKLDNIDYSDKIKEIICLNDTKDITVIRMSVPCCTGIVNAAKKAIINSNKDINFNVITVATNGEIIV